MLKQTNSFEEKKEEIKEEDNALDEDENDEADEVMDTENDIQDEKSLKIFEHSDATKLTPKQKKKSKLSPEEKAIMLQTEKVIINMRV